MPSSLPSTNSKFLQAQNAAPRCDYYYIVSYTSRSKHIRLDKALITNITKVQRQSDLHTQTHTHIHIQLQDITRDLMWGHHGWIWILLVPCRTERESILFFEFNSLQLFFFLLLLLFYYKRDPLLPHQEAQTIVQ